MKVKRWAFVHGITIYERDPCYEALSADEFKEPVEIYLGLTFKNRPTVERSIFFGTYLYFLGQVWVDL